VTGVAQDGITSPRRRVTALADTLTDEEALGVGVFATAFHLFQDGLVGGGDVELGIVHDPVRGRRVRGWVGNFEVTLEVDAGSIVGDVEGKPYAMTVTSGYVSSPDFQVDYRHATYVAGDMDVDAQDFTSTGPPGLQPAVRLRQAAPRRGWTYRPHRSSTSGSDARDAAASRARPRRSGWRGLDAGPCEGGQSRASNVARWWTSEVPCPCPLQAVLSR
jgi:hypothetical protein